MGGRLYGFQGSGSNTTTIDVGANLVYKSGNSKQQSILPGALMVCLYVMSSNKWIPCNQSMLK